MSKDSFDDHFDEYQAKKRAKKTIERGIKNKAIPIGILKERFNLEELTVQIKTEKIRGTPITQIFLTIPSSTYAITTAARTGANI